MRRWGIAQRVDALTRPSAPGEPLRPPQQHQRPDATEQEVTRANQTHTLLVILLALLVVEGLLEMEVHLVQDKGHFILKFEFIQNEQEGFFGPGFFDVII